MMLEACRRWEQREIESEILPVQEIGSDVITNVAGLTVRVYRSADQTRWIISSDEGDIRQGWIPLVKSFEDESDKNVVMFDWIPMPEVRWGAQRNTVTASCLFVLIE